MQTSAAAFTKGLLDLEGNALTPILVRWGDYSYCMFAKCVQNSAIFSICVQKSAIFSIRVQKSAIFLYRRQGTVGLGREKRSRPH